MGKNHSISNQSNKRCTAGKTVQRFFSSLTMRYKLWYNNSVYIDSSQNSVNIIRIR